MHERQPDGTGSPLEELVFEYLERRESEGEAVLDELCAAHPELAGKLRKHVATVEDSGLLERHVEGDVPERLGDFRLLERLGAGGMGIVYRAHQESLDREVALKLVRPEQLVFDQGRARFQREVMVVARLNHPGIVPVYAIGEERGLPFFVMERVHGATLAELLKALPGGGSAQLTGGDLAEALDAVLGDAPLFEPVPLFHGSWEETCLRIVREVAEALEHAHRLGVLHRDIKPSNVMVTPRGRVMLLDFGLSSEEGSERLTRTGSAVGSLPYMAPELFDGAAATRASDVYGLGAMLFELLSLELPIEFGNLAELRARVASGEIRALRRFNPRASWESETVCLKALEHEPERRYVSAQDLARDLSNVLERRPIQARRASAALRVRRWVQRHTAASVAVGLGALLLVGGPIAYAAQQRSAMRRVQAESELAKANLHKAVLAIHSSLSEIAQLELRDVPRAEGVRRTVVDVAVQLFEELELTNPDDVELAKRTAFSWRLLATMQRDQGQLAEAQNNLDRVLELQARLAESDAGDPDSRLHLAETWFERAALHQAQGDLPAAADALTRALETTATEPVDGARRLDLLVLRGRIRMDLGRLALRHREYGEAELQLKQCIQDCDEARALDPADPRAFSDQGRARRNLADALSGLGRLEDARQEYVASIAQLEAALGQNPDRLFDQSHLATALGNLGSLLIKTGDFAQGREALGRAIEIHETLVANYPHEFQLSRLLGENFQALGSSYVREERPADALPHYEDSVAVLEPLLERLPQSSEVRHELAKTLQALAIATAQSTGTTEAALELTERAIELEASALQDQPDNPDYQRALERQEGLRAALGG